MKKFHRNECVTKIMSSRVMTASHGTKISELAEFFKKSPVKHVPVVDKDRHLCGIVSESDIKRVNYAEALNEDERAVFAHLDHTMTLEDIMTKNPVSIRPEASIKIAAETLAHEEFRALPVVKENGDVVGLVTTADILRYFVTTVY